MQSEEQNYIRLLKRAAAVGCAVLCVDLGFVACGSGSESVELVQVEEETESAESSAVSEEESENTDPSDEMESDDGNAEEPDAAVSGEMTGNSAVIYVHVCGAVIYPGVYALPEGSRVYEAVEAAGGFAADADEDYVNQALILVDQDRLEIPTVSQTASGQDSSSAESGYGITSAEGSSASGSGASSSGLINLNTATQAELETLPGIGEAKAKAIIAYREENGAFSSIEEIQEVSGIGEATYANLKDLITVD